MTASIHSLHDDKLAQAAHWCLRLGESALSDAEQAQLEAWLNADADHGRLLDDATAAWQAVELQARRPEMLALRSEALADARTVQKRRHWRLGNTGVRIAVAATLVMLIGGGTLWQLEAPKTYTTGIGERRVIVMPDGSKLSLDALTKVDVRYTNDRRRFWLERGRAKFDVAKNPLRPFTVDANGKLVVATGTQFSVELVQKQVRVNLYEGHVVILNDRASLSDATLKAAHGSAAKTQNLAPGQELIATAPDDMGVVRALNPADAPVWEGGQLVFADERLATVVERANRYSDQKLVLADVATGDQRISGVFTAGDTTGLVTAITSLLPVRATQSDGTTRLSITKPVIISQADTAGLRP